MEVPGTAFSRALEVAESGDSIKFLDDRIEYYNGSGCLIATFDYEGDEWYDKDD